METPPVISSKPPVSPPAKKPFAVQAARASFLAPIIAFVCGIVVKGAIVNSHMQIPRIVNIITGSCGCLLILLGFVLGIVALFGIRRHGKKEILGYAIAGLCINGIIIIMMINLHFALKNMAHHAQ